MADAWARRPRLFAAATAVELLRLERSGRRSAEAMREAQRHQLVEALAGARRTTFWREHLGAVDVTDQAGLEQLPLSDKPLVRAVEESARLLAPPPPGTRTMETSGTSGIPLVVHYGPRAAWFQGVLRLRSSLHRGTRPWQRSGSMTIAGDTRRTPGIVGATARAQSVRLHQAMSREELAQRVLERRPASLSGHMHLLIELGEALDGRYRPKGVFTHGETVGDDDRRELRELWGVEPLDSYGTAECGRIAWQCTAADLYHVNHEAVVVEIVDDHGRQVSDGTQGNIVLTSLWNPLMPFVRYRIGDSAAWATRRCRCGSPQPVLTDLAGRTFNWIVAADGRRVAPQRMWASLQLGAAYLPIVARYRVRQDETRRIVVEVVPREGFEQHHIDTWRASYRELLGDLPIEFHVVDRIDTVPGEKFEIISSRATP